MGNCVTNGSGENTANKGSKSQKAKKPKESGRLQPSPSEQEAFHRTKRSDYSTLNWNKRAEIGFKIPTPPLLNGNEIIFLSTANNSTVYSIYNINTLQFTVESEEIKCDSDDFDVINTVYTLNPDTNKIYFIENNKDIKVLDMASKQKELISLNKSISTKNENVATIQYNNGKVYIIGAEDYTEIDKETKEENQYTSDRCDEYIIIPYSTARMKTSDSKSVEVIKKAGSFSRVLNVDRDGMKCIYIMGGKKDYNNKGTKPLIYPNHSIWTLTLLDNTGNHEWRSTAYDNTLSISKVNSDDEKFVMKGYHTQEPMHSFGIINVENMYLISFGGTEWRRSNVKKVGYIWILALMKKNQFGLRYNWWHEMHLKLPQKRHFHALYPNDGTDIIHLFNYDGEYYTVKMKDIMDKLKANEFHKQHPWTETPYYIIPTNSKRFVNFGPREDTEVDELLDDLAQNVHKAYGKYKVGFDNTGYDKLEQLINDKDDILEKVVENEEHRKVIIEKAKEKRNANNNNNNNNNT